MAATSAATSDVTIEDPGRELTWFPVPGAEYGFCRTCGASLFWDPIHKDFIGVAMGAFDAPTNTKLAIHIYVADKGDYYEITDGLPQNPQ